MEYIYFLASLSVVAQLLGSGALFISKAALIFEQFKKLGWWLGIIGVVILTYIVYVREFWVMCASHLGIIVLCAFGLHTLRTQHIAIPQSTKFRVRAGIITVTIAVCGFLAYETYALGNFTEWQFFHATTGLLGALFLAFNTKVSNTVGWIWNIISHLCCIHYMGLAGGLETVVFFQKLSIGVSFIGIAKELWFTKKPT